MATFASTTGCSTAATAPGPGVAAVSTAVRRARAGLPYWSLSQYLKLKVKNAVSYITSFEEALAAEARKQGLDGVICGHIHKPEIRDIDGIKYCNDGDWVESLSALVEDATGELRLVDWHEVMLRWEQAQLVAEDELCAEPA